MKHLSIALVAVLALTAFGCKKKGGADCDTAINHSMELSKAEMAKQPGTDDAMLKKMSDLGRQHCKDDKWSDDAVKCMVDAKAMADAQGCFGKLTQDQQDKMMKAAMALAPAPAPAGSAVAAPTGTETGSAMAPAPAGSDMGSAAMAGSAAAPAGSDAGSAVGSAK